MILIVNSNNVGYENLNTTMEIIISAITISLTVFITSTKDPLSNCMEKIMAVGRNAMVAANLCSGNSK